jgi:preprotein translocase subunit SecD
VTDVQLLRSTDAWLLQVTLDPDAAEDLAAMGESAASSDSRLAILADGLVLSAPTVAGTLSDTLQLTGDWSGEQAERYAALLRP